MIESALAWKVATVLFTGGVAFGGVKVALNGTKRRLDQLEDNEQVGVDSRIKVAERLTAVETKIDMIYEKVK